MTKVVPHTFFSYFQLKVFSSDISRCLMSAYCNLAAMFPPGPGRQFNASLNWQPIPVHTRPTTDDNVCTAISISNILIQHIKKKQFGVNCDLLLVS